MTNFISSLNAIGPIFLVIGFGFFLKRFNKINEEFIKQANYIVFNFGLPLNLFNKTYKEDISNIFNGKLLFFALSALIIVTLILFLIVPIFIHNKKKSGSFIQSAFRSNFTLLGTVMSLSLFGEKGSIPTISLIPVIIPTLMILSIIVFSLFSIDDNNKSFNIYKIIIKIIKNPLIIGIAIGLLFQLVSIKLPIVIEKSIDDVTKITTPLALIALGAQLKFQKINELKTVLACTFLKLILIPLAVLTCAYYFEFSGYEMGALFLLFAAPSGVSNYSLAYSMNSDYHFTGNVIVVSTMLSFVTMFLGIYIFNVLNIF